MILQSVHVPPYGGQVELPYTWAKVVGVTLSDSEDCYAHFECDHFGDDRIVYEFAFVEDGDLRPDEHGGWRYVTTIERGGFGHIYARTAR